MLIWILSTKEASEKIVSYYGMQKIDENSHFDLYKSKNKILIIIDEDNINKSLLYIYSEFNPKMFFFFWLAESISNEHLDWDIVLPNVFVKLQEGIENILFKKDNLSDFLKDPIFLESYNLQNDYDFEKFGLSIWWISVSWDIEAWSDLKEKIRFAYESDTYDSYSYFVLDEAKNLDILNKFYVISVIHNKENSILPDSTIENGLYILNFLLDNIWSEEDILEINID